MNDLQTLKFQNNALQSVFNWLQNQLLSKFYYFLIPLYNGTKLFNNNQINIYTLKRNIHRIEKGLIQKNRKAVFAQDFILETVFAYHLNKSSSTVDIEILSWVEAVLDAYFKAVDKSAPMIMEAWTYFQGLNPDNKQPKNKPYLISERPHLSVSYADLLDLSRRRRSVRHFTEKLVDEQIVKKALAVAAQAPSACNRQAFRFLFFNNPEVVSKIAKITGGVSGYELPALIIIISDYSAYADARDIKSPIIDASLAAMSFCYALETLGLSSVCINWPCEVAFDEMLRKIVAIEKNESVIMLLGLGYPAPDAVIPFSAKKSVDCLLSVNKRII